MTIEDQFVDHWRDRIIGMALRGMVLDGDERTKGPLSAGAAALALPEKSDKMLRQMFQHTVKLLGQPKPAAT